MRSACPGVSAEARGKQLNSSVLAWARRVGLGTGTVEEERLAAMRLGEFAARVVPEAGAAEAELTAQWAAFVCLVDDRLDRGGLGSRPEEVRALFGGLLGVLTANRAVVSSGEVETALTDLWRRTAPCMSSRWRERFITDYREFAQATYQEATGRRDRVGLPLDDYILLRRRTITVFPMADIVECTAGAPWPDHLGCDLAVRALRQAAADVAGWTNDLVSADGDLQAGQESLVAVVGREHGCSPSAAHERVTTMRDDRLRDFYTIAAVLAAGEGVPPAAREPLRSYVGALGSFLAATLHWLGVTGRFETRWLSGSHGGPASSVVL
ncbi:terpene synthase family protein [Streptomyces sp. NL15-2K]|uniref:terpene synthase family protein n=1 Tax=Streptomyces sp. NL15-2K TaxID=376149 RepID=UPI000F56E5A7|nr:MULTISPECIES: terpene synthase family protein [Actinomycetes]WKX06007.1 terpene synthase family protein [Kutzneria buriramensis]